MRMNQLFLLATYSVTFKELNGFTNGNVSVAIVEFLFYYKLTEQKFRKTQQRAGLHGLDIILIKKKS